MNILKDTELSFDWLFENLQLSKRQWLMQHLLVFIRNRYQTTKLRRIQMRSISGRCA